MADWSIHRGAAVFVEGARNITLEGLTFDQVSGNAILFSNDVTDSTIRKCSFKDVGDSAIAMLGSTQQMVGTHGKGLFPAHNLIEANIVDTVGVYGKQTSAYFKAKSRENTVRNNVRVIDHIITTIAATSPWLSRSPFASKIDYQPSVARLAGVHERA